MDTLLGYIDVQIPLDDKFWTVRLAFYPQPIAADPLVVMCSDAHRIETIAKNGAVIDGAPDFARGDVMYCQKGAASDECAPTDFSWMDSASHAFVTTRPASPHRLDALVDRTSLSATINYDLGEFVFFPGITDAASATPEALLNVVTLAPIHGRQVLGPGPGAGAFSSATLTLMLGHEPAPSCGGPTEGPDGGTATVDRAARVPDRTSTLGMGMPPPGTAACRWSPATTLAYPVLA